MLLLSSSLALSHSPIPTVPGDTATRHPSASFVERPCNLLWCTLCFGFPWLSCLHPASAPGSPGASPRAALAPVGAQPLCSHHPFLWRRSMNSVKKKSGERRTFHSFICRNNLFGEKNRALLQSQRCSSRAVHKDSPSKRSTCP